MAVSRAPESPTVRAFETTVTAVDGRDVTLAETYFYPEGGGQPADRGSIDGIELETVREREGTVVHTLASAPSVAVGETVACTIDDAFRTYCMRAHTASHVVYGAARRLFDDLGYAGFDIGTEKVRLDLTTNEPIDDDALVELGRLSNRAVWDARPVTWERLPFEEARSIDGVAFNERTEAGALAGGDPGESADRIRVVTIGGGTVGSDGRERADDPWDVAACGGTHVANTRRIGPIEVLDRSNPGEGVTRVEFAVGPVGIDHAAAVRASAREASQLGGVPETELPELVARLQDERETVAADLERLEQALVASRLAEFSTVDREGAVWAVGTIERVDSDAVANRARAVVGDGDGPDVVAAVVGESPSLVVASGGDVDAAAVVDGVTDAFGGGGGGSATFAQAGGFDAEADDVVTLLLEE